MYAEERQQAMVKLVTRQGRVSVTDLSREFDVTTETVRRDLSALERLNLLRRVHGGAVPADTFTVIEVALSDRDAANPEAKERIAAAAIELLPGAASTVLIDAGSTTGRFAALIPRERPLTVFTHAVPIAARLASQPNVELHLLPGRVRPATQAAVGAETIEALGRIRADIAILGTNGISVSHGLSTPDDAEAAAKRAMVAAAQRVVVLADSAKIGQERTLRFAEISQVDVLVTDGAITTFDRAALEEAGVEVIVA